MNLGHETETVEFKKSTGELREGMESIAAILNKHGHGSLYFGVRDDGEVVGQEISATTLRKVSQAVGSAIEPAIYPEIGMLEDEEGHGYLRIDFSGDEPPYACAGRYRIRMSGEDILMSQEELRRQMLRAQARKVPWDQWESDRPICDVDEEELRAYVARGNASGRISEPFTSTEDVLGRLGLLRSGKLTNAAEVLFCPSTVPQLSLGMLADHTRTEILDLRHEQGTLFQLVRSAEHYILVNTRRRFVITGNGPREEVPELPREAVREVLFNAFAHRDWLSPASVQIEIYNDAVEVYNPGWFLGAEGPEGHISGAEHSSVSRNTLITSALHRSKDIEAYGTGIPRIMRACAGAGVTFEYQRAGDGTRFVFHRNDAFESAGSARTGAEECADGAESARTGAEECADGAESAQPNASGHGALTITERAIVKALGRYGAMGSAALADEIGLSKRGTQKVLQRMVEEGLVTRTGASHATRYELSATAATGLGDNQ